jgi:hypothetical protein
VNIEFHHGTLKRWFSFEIKGLKGCQIDWLVWRLTTIVAWHYMHTSKLKKKRVHKKQGYGMYCENKCGESNIELINACISTILWNKWVLDCKESTSCQCGIKNEILVYVIFKLHMWMGITKESLQALNRYYFHDHQCYPRRCHWLLWNMVRI